MLGNEKSHTEGLMCHVDEVKEQAQVNKTFWYRDVMCIDRNAAQYRESHCFHVIFVGLIFKNQCVHCTSIVPFGQFVEVHFAAGNTHCCWPHPMGNNNPESDQSS